MSTELEDRLAGGAGGWEEEPGLTAGPAAKQDSGLNSLETYWDYSVELECISGQQGIAARPAPPLSSPTTQLCQSPTFANLHPVPVVVSMKST